MRDRTVLLPVYVGSRHSLEDVIERLIAVAGELGGDADMEEGGHLEPSKGARNDLEEDPVYYNHPSQIWGGQGA